MAIRFHRSLKLLPGIRLNFGKRGIGVSAGVCGLHVGVDTRGKAYTSASIPGTGLSVRNYAKRGDLKAAQYSNAFVLGIVMALGIILVLAIIGMSQPSR
jgi:hypothetical protein